MDTEPVKRAPAVEPLSCEIGARGRPVESTDTRDELAVANAAHEARIGHARRLIDIWREQGEHAGDAKTVLLCVFVALGGER